jgi:hypothetical protein
MKQDQRATLSLRTELDAPDKQAIYSKVQQAGYKITTSFVAYNNQAQQRELEFRLRWRMSPQDLDSPPFLKELLNDPHVLTVHWKATT